MRCGRGLRATHYIVRPRLTDLGLGTAWAIRVVIPSTNSPIDFAKKCSLSLFAKFTQNSWYIMGIPSLNSAILYCVSLYFHYKDPSLTLRMTGSCSGWHLNHANIRNIPDLGHKKGFFSGREAQFAVHIHENKHFHGWEMKFGIGSFMHHVLFNE